MDEKTDPDIFDKFLQKKGHKTETKDWISDKNKKQCPECYSVHKTEATKCTVCGWFKINN